MMELWMVAVFAVAAYCFARGMVDLRRRRFVWGGLGILAGVLIMTVPIPTHAIKYDVLWPANSQG